MKYCVLYFGDCMLTKLKITALIFITTVFFLGGCSDNSTSSSEDLSTLNLEDPFGGYLSIDEAPGFGDSEILKLFPEPDQASYDLNDFNSLRSVEDDPEILVYAFRVAWGMLEYDSTVTQVSDWSGSLVSPEGFIKAIHKIYFENQTDHFVRPRTDIHTLEWVSYTSVHQDGFLAFIYFRPEVDPAATEVTFTAGTYSRTFTLLELDSLDEIVDVDNLGNQISFIAQKLERLDCEEGVMEGRWIKTGQHNGHFIGRYLSRDGLFLGHVRGHWGIRGQDEKVFFGKWIDKFGRFSGLIKGQWDYEFSTDASESSGTFDGNFFDSNANMLGTLSGKWVSHHRGSMPNSGTTDKVPKKAGGFFHSWWKQYCN